MRFDWSRALTIARREFLTTVRRKAFVFTLVGTPMIYALILFVMIKPQVDDALKNMREFRTLAVVDSSGLYRDAPREIVTEVDLEGATLRRGASMPPVPRQAFVTKVRYFDDPAPALDSLARGAVRQVVVIPPDYAETGRLRRYVGSENVFNDDQQERPVTRWLQRGLLAGRVDSSLAERVVRPARRMEVYTLDRAGHWAPRDRSGSMMEFLVPFIAGLLLSMSILIGGQYLLQGVSEEKESRILESMLCSVTPQDLVVGKLIGLGGAGLSLVLAWVSMIAAVSGPAMLGVKIPISGAMVGLMVAYFLFGYLFYASIMTGIGAITNSMREATQFSFLFTFMNFVPFYMLSTIIAHPESPLATGLSMFPPTAATSMLLRVTAPGSHVPGWQIALSLALLAGSAWLALQMAAKIFRIGLLLYGKTPTLPEILHWMRSR